MANTYTQIYLHVVFVVKSRENIILPGHKEEIYKYIKGIIENKHNKAFIINGHFDHIHALLSLNPNESISDLMKEIKRCSSAYINEHNLVGGHFEWQSGYAAFSVSKSQVDAVYKYIENQEEHHSVRTFREEYLEFLKKYDIKYDERYIFTEV